MTNVIEMGYEICITKRFGSDYEVQSAKIINRRTKKIGMSQHTDTRMSQNKKHGRKKKIHF